jgi:hypothetical protein
MNMKIYNAVLTQLKGKSMEHLANIDLYLNDPTMVPDHSTIVQEVIKSAKEMSECEGAFRCLQQHFSPQPKTKAPPAKPPTPPPPAPPEVDSEPTTEAELLKRSPTFRKSQANKDK